jgi:hypothetical protein
MLCSYFFAYLLGPGVGNIINNQFGSPKIISMVIGSMIVFFIVSLIFGSVRSIIASKNKKTVKKDKKKLSTTSRLSGATIKLAIALIMASIAVWGYSLLRVSPVKELAPPIDNSVVLKISRSIIKQGAYIVISKLIPERSKALQMATMISRPEESLNNVNNIAKNPKIREMIADQAFMDDFLSGDSSKILENEKFTAVMNDDELMEQVKSLDTSGDMDSDEYKKQFAQKMAKMGSNIKKFSEDPEIKENIKSLKEDGLLKKENVQKLITDRRFMILVDKFMTENKTEKE